MTTRTREPKRKRKRKPREQTPAEALATLEAEPLNWLTAMFGPKPHDFDADGVLKRNATALVTAAFAAHHEQFWNYVARIEEGETIVIDGVVRDAFIAIWARGHTKTTSVEMAAGYVIAKRARRFIVIISKSQTQANERV